MYRVAYLYTCTCFMHFVVYLINIARNLCGQNGITTVYWYVQYCTHMKYFLLGVGIAGLLGLGYWAVTQSGWFDGSAVPSNLPTAEERKRMQEIEISSSQIAPNAKAGAGVRPVGSLPKEPEPTEVSTSTEDTSTVENTD